MKRLLFKQGKSFAVAFVCVILLLCVCGKNSTGLEDNPEFVGDWQCADAPMEHPDYYTGYIVWAVNEDGSFSMYDAEAGNPGIKGSMQIISENELQLNCNTEDDFDPPVTWGKMAENQKLRYEFITDKELKVSFVNEDGKSTLVFTKME